MASALVEEYFLTDFRSKAKNFDGFGCLAKQCFAAQKQHFQDDDAIFALKILKSMYSYLRQNSCLLYTSPSPRDS